MLFSGTGELASVCFLFAPSADPKYDTTIHIDLPPLGRAPFAIALYDSTPERGG